MSDAPDQRDGTGPADRNDPGWPSPVYNWMSGIGVVLFAIAAAAGLFLFVVSTAVGAGSGYGGLTFLPLAALALVGLLLLLAGWLRERYRQARGRHSSFFETWVVDPWAIVRDRGVWFIPAAVAAGTLVLLGTGAGTVGVVHYSESNQFCTAACHSVMGPEGVVYEETAHSRVDCVTCHVGAGAEGFLAAKLGGLRQLYHFASGSVTRPIPTPIHGSTIDRALCESCHAPERYAGIQARTHTYYLAGEDTEPVRLAMVTNVAGVESGLHLGAGVHYHMQIASKVEYVARDAQRQEIAWVRITDRKGEAREFELESDPLSEADRASLPVHEMECIDCHSRPAHRFPSAIDSVNHAIEMRRLPRDMPYIKQVAVEALDGDYETTPEAIEGIESYLREFYEDEYPEVLEERESDFAASVEALRDVYTSSIFPEMQADWRAHPDNSGHRDSPGCFRCHNDEMLDAEGESVTTDCASCHVILAQSTEPVATKIDFEAGQPFVHPEDGSEIDEFTLCSDCHTGGKELYE